MNTAIDWSRASNTLELFGPLDPETLETLPERRACLRVLELIDAFLVAHPQVEMIGLDLAASEVGGTYDRLSGRFALAEGFGVDTRAHPASKDFETLVKELDDCLMGNTLWSVQFCMDTVFDLDPGGDFSYILSQQGLDAALERALGAKVSLEMREEGDLLERNTAAKPPRV